jgi:hypothetical protein
MSHVISPYEDMIITGFIKKNYPKNINNHPRIFLGLKNKDGSGDVYKIGYKLQYKNKKLSMYRILIMVTYEISFCDIDKKYMESQDIETLDFYTNKKHLFYTMIGF